jgi:hypothetical protein
VLSPENLHRVDSVLTQQINDLPRSDDPVVVIGDEK